MKTHKRALAILAPAIAILLACGIASAAWTSTGTGTAAAKAGSISFQVNTTSTTSGLSITNLLHPGSAAGGTGDTAGGDLKVTLRNTSGFTVHIVSITQTAGAAVTVDSTHVTAGCTSDTAGTPVVLGTSGVSLPTWTAPDGTKTVAADSVDHEFVISNVVAMASTSNSGCQGATFTIPVTVTLGT